MKFGVLSSEFGVWNDMRTKAKVVKDLFIFYNGDGVRFFLDQLIFERFRNKFGMTICFLTFAL
jgi:hypothetical protein